jgi:UDP-N-acetylmuramoyl-tripeptide--D-alanyl-D-alanine ligase
MADKLWSQDALKKALNPIKITESDFAGGEISIDSRSLKKGEIFLALKGEHVDGHDYLKAAIEKGASALIVSDESKIPPLCTLPVIVVKEGLEALQALGAYARARSKAVIIGITGSVGKTSTKEMFGAVLAHYGQTHYSRKSYNNHIGVPLTLANLPPDALYGVFEMGMNHAGEISKLTSQVKPDIAIITTIEPVHIEFFKSIEGIADAKAEIFEGLMDGKGVALLFKDNPHYERLRKAALARNIGVIPFGEDEEAKARAVHALLKADYSEVTAEINGKRYDYRLALSGMHQVMNSLCVLGVLAHLHLPLEKAFAAFKEFTPTEGRGNRFEVTLKEGEPPLILIDESYNASPASMKATFKVVEMIKPREGGRRIAVLGDMLELGKDGPSLHQDLANPILKAKIDKVYTAGALMAALFEALPKEWQGAQAKDSQALAALLLKELKSGDVVVVKGSNGSKMAYIVQAIRDLDIKAQAQHKQNGNGGVKNKNAL